MITVPEIVEAIVRQSPYLGDGLAQRIINVSALARKILPRVKKEAMKDIQVGAVVMALNRLSRRLEEGDEIQRKIFPGSPDLLVRSRLIEMTYAFSESLIRHQKELLDQISIHRDYFITFTHGVFEMMVISSCDLEDQVREVFQSERLTARIDGLSAITVKLPTGTTETPGVYSFILKTLAWERINVVDVVSTFNEFTIIIRDEDVERSFFILKRIS